LAAPPFDWLDSMMWSIAASGLIVAIAALRLRYNATTDTIEEENKSLAAGLGLALTATGFYLFLAGITISFKWAFSSSYANILFGGAGALGGLVLISAGLAITFRKGLQGTSYFALITAIYLLVDAVAIVQYNRTSNPWQTAILYGAPAVAMILAVPATHVKNRAARWVFAVFAILYAIGWIYLAANTTMSHLS